MMAIRFAFFLVVYLNTCCCFFVKGKRGFFLQATQGVGWVSCFGIYQLAGQKGPREGVFFLCVGFRGHGISAGCFENKCM